MAYGSGIGRHSANLTMRFAALLILVLSSACFAAEGGTPADCPRCVEWTVPQKPFRIYGNTYYVGTQALTSILVTSPKGHVLIDGTVQEGAAQVAANIRALGFRIEDVRLILNTHVHYDHAGGIAALQRMSGAEVASSAPSASVLMQGHLDVDDPQFDDHPRGTEPIKHVRIIKDGQQVSAGSLSLTAHLTPGHTPGGTSWSWKSCEQKRCLNVVYADSLTAVSADDFRFSDSTSDPGVLKDFAHSFDVLSNLPCDILITPHPELSDLMGRLQRRDSGSDPNAFVDSGACRRYVGEMRGRLQKRLDKEAHAG